MIRNVKWATACGLLAGLAAAAPAQVNQKAMLRVYLPAPNTQLVIQGVPLKVTDKDVRLFESPELQAGKAFVYDIKASWTEAGKAMTRERSVKVMAGLTTEVDLRKAEDNSPDIVKPPSAAKSPDSTKPATPMTPADSVKPAEPKPDEPKPGEKKPAEAAKSPEPKKPDEKPAEPYIATPPTVVEAMLKLAKVTEADVVYDLGFGNGQIAATAVGKFKAKKAVGIDASLDRLPEALKTPSPADKVEFRKADLTKLTEADLAEATVVTVDGSAIKHLAQLAPVLKKLKPGTRIVSHELEIPGMKLDDKDEKTVGGLDHAMFLYTIK